MLGFFNCNKSKGVSSGFVVNKIKHATHEKCGHLGTLDPNATGVLPIAIGKATRFFDYFLKKDKVYEAVCQFGMLSSTLDLEGEILEMQDVDVQEEKVQEFLPKLTGTIMQTPPIYSAISINGKRAYEYAKNNEEINLEPRECKIFEFRLVKKIKKNTYSFYIHCAAGTYVRSLLLDLAKLMGTVSTTLEINRIKSGPFDIAKACTVEEICADPQKHLIDVTDVVKLPKVNVDAQTKTDIQNGKTPALKDIPSGEFFVYHNGEIICLAENVSGKIKSKIYLYSE